MIRWFERVMYKVLLSHLNWHYQRNVEKSTHTFFKSVDDKTLEEVVEEFLGEGCSKKDVTKFIEVLRGEKL